MDTPRTSSQRSTHHRNATPLARSRHDSYASSAHESAFAELVENRREEKAVYQFKVIVIGDFIFSSILWLLIMVTHGGDLLKDFLDEVNITDPQFFSKSMFDVLICAVLRCVTLFVVYGILHKKSMIAVAITSAITAVLVGVKVVYYFRGEASAPIAQLILIIGTILAIGIELARIPSGRERRRRTGDEEHLITSNSESQAYRNARIDAIRSGLTDDDYRTAMELSDDSDDGDDVTGTTLSKYQRKVQKLLRQKALEKVPAYRPYSNAEFLETARSARLTGDRWLHEMSKWSRASNIPLVRWADDKEHGRVYYLQVEIAVPSKIIFDILYTNFNKIPTWNKNVLENKIVCRIDATTDVIYNLTASQLRGAISSRDFLDVRQIEHDAEKNIYSIALESVYADLVPPSSDKKIVRGHNGPNFWRIRPVQDENHSILEWFNNTNLRVSLPRRMMHSGIVNFLIEYSKLLTEQCQKAHGTTI